MTYSSGGLIQATDYNTFISTGTPNINNIWGTGSGDSGWGQTSIATVAGPSPGPADLVTATQCLQAAQHQQLDKPSLF